MIIKKIKSLIDRHRQLLLVILFFGLIYSLISLVNHYNFRTYALDLGAYTNALYDYVRLQWNDSTVFKENPENLLADHFDLYLILFSPLSLIFGTYTLLIVQIFFLLLGGTGIYYYFLANQDSGRLPLLAALHFFVFFGVFSALAYDYHSNVVAASLLPWFLVFVRKRKRLWSACVFIVILISKENISLWMSFVSLGLAIEYIRFPSVRNYLLGLSFCSALYFVLVLTVFMPAISHHGTYPHFHYSALGENIGEAVLQLLAHPFDALTGLFTNHTHNATGDYVKAELHILLLLSGLPLLLFRPQYLLMLLPLYFQKMLHDNTFMWSIAGQYNIEFAPIITIASFTILENFQSSKPKNITAGLLIMFTLLSTIRTMDKTIFFTDKSRIRIYQASHYKRDYDVKKVREALSGIPVNAIVCAQSPFLPHLALRDNIYQFPLIGDAEYIVFSEIEVHYPLDEKSFSEIIHGLKDSGTWTKEYDDENLVILRRLKSTASH